MSNCRLCDSRTEVFATASILGKHAARYLRCSDCGFIFIPDPDWLPEAYSSALTRADVGVMHRNLMAVNLTCSVIGLIRPKAKLFLDFGGGHGTLVRMMRDLGFDFRWSDAYAENLFARGFEHEQGRSYDLLTAFEVLEHLPHPMDEISRMMDLADDLLVSTEVLPDPPPRPTEWWYYTPSTGQHISFYSIKALRVIARTFGRRLVSMRGFHLFTRTEVSPLMFSVATQPRIARILKSLVRRPSLIEADFRMLTT